MLPNFPASVHNYTDQRPRTWMSSSARDDFWILARVLGRFSGEFEWFWKNLPEIFVNLKTDLTLKSTLSMELCILYENSTKVLKAFQNTDKLTAIKRGEKKAISCYKCGKKGHTTKIYKATIEPCTTCGSNSHLTSLNNPNYHKKTFFPKKSKT